MSGRYALRLVVAALAAVLLILSLAYNWLGGLAHEWIGVAFLVIISAHITANRRWFLRLGRGWKHSQVVYGKVTPLLVLAVVMTLLVTSVIISRSVFAAIPITSTVSARQIHALAGYAAVIIAAVHVGAQWQVILAAVSRAFLMPNISRPQAFLLRSAAILIAAVGIWSFIDLGYSSKLLMEITFDTWDFQTSPAVVFFQLIVIFGLFVVISHYARKLLRSF